MCGYGGDAHGEEVPEDALLKQFEKAMEKFDGHRIVKIFNSGSFLDDSEITAGVRTKILKELADKDVRIVIESRAEFVTQEALDEVKKFSSDIEIALGLETVSELVNKLCVNKGSGLKDYLRAVELISDNGLRVRTYLLLKPPLLSENDALKDVWQSMELIRDRTDVISINPVNVQKGTVVERLWKNNQYRPPWLWSLLEILKRVRSWQGDGGRRPMVVSSPSGAGTRRGVHNCKKCDKTMLSSVRRFSQTQESSVIEDALKQDCVCKEEWQDLLDLEDFTFTAVGRIKYF
jgi:radical SAM enzyme (TIGR01210 family)